MWDWAEAVVRDGQEPVLLNRLRELLGGFFELLARQKFLADTVELQRVAPVLFARNLLGVRRPCQPGDRDRGKQRLMEGHGRLLKKNGGHRGGPHRIAVEDRT
jgi:hypothetical protein